jgi:hypothetical protein
LCGLLELSLAFYLVIF